MEPELVRGIMENYLSKGIFPIREAPEDSLARKFTWPKTESDFSKTIPDSFIKARINEEYSQLKYTNENPEYKIFLLAKKPSTIIDMNYEGFSVNYLKRYHHVIPLHGLANSDLAEHTKIVQEDILLWDLDFSQFSTIELYPGEKQLVKVINKYKNHLENIFAQMHWLIIIGYSFANRGSYLNDQPLYEFVKDQVERYKQIKIIIINPNPEPIAVLFEKELDRTIIIPAYWDRLTRAIISNYFILPKDSINNILRYYIRNECE